MIICSGFIELIVDKILDICSFSSSDRNISVGKVIYFMINCDHSRTSQGLNGASVSGTNTNGTTVEQC